MLQIIVTDSSRNMKDQRILLIYLSCIVNFFKTYAEYIYNLQTCKCNCTAYRIQNNVTVEMGATLPTVTVTTTEPPVVTNNTKYSVINKDQESQVNGQNVINMEIPLYQRSCGIQVYPRDNGKSPIRLSKYTLSKI